MEVQRRMDGEGGVVGRGGGKGSDGQHWSVWLLAMMFSCLKVKSCDDVM